MNSKAVVYIVILMMSVMGPWAAADEKAKASAPATTVMEKYDHDGDKRITEAEILASKRDLFDEVDQDHNGGLTVEEYIRIEAVKRRLALEARFSKLDRNGDGKVCEDEFSRIRPMFARLDRNRDGAITDDEI